MGSQGWVAVVNVDPLQMIPDAFFGHWCRNEKGVHRGGTDKEYLNL
jgi:hypothetical protein